MTTQRHELRGEAGQPLSELRMPPAEVCERARLARDARFDGRFFIGVRTTDIFCRPVCPVRPPKARNVRFFPTAAAASEAGYRPCLRCRPEAAPGTPAWVGTSATVSRALRLMDQGAFDEGGIEHLAERLGVGSRHLRRLFLEHLGASPVAVAQTRRLLFAKKLLDETELSMTMVSECAGFGSLRRFNEVFRQVYGRTPRELRKNGVAKRAGPQTGLRMQLAFRPPYDWSAAMSYLALRATPGVEEVTADAYRRTIRLGDQQGRIEVVPELDANALALRVEFPDLRALGQIVQRVRRMFDLEADPMEIASHLGRDPLLAPRLAAHGGLRLIGTWEGFELTIRAILGQQVSVKGATTLAGRLAERYGETLSNACGEGPGRLFPTPEALAGANLRSVGLPAARARALRELSRAVLRGEVRFDAPLDVAAIVAQLTRIPGIGDWTAQYVALRAFGEPDALPATDLGLLKSIGGANGAAKAAELRERAEAWRPWRSYAAMHLWNH